MTVAEAVSVARERAADAAGVVRAGGDSLVSGAVAVTDQVRRGTEAAADALPAALDTVRSGTSEVAARVPDAADAVRAGALEAARSLQELPDPNLRLLVAFSMGVGAGLYLSGAPRFVTLMAAAPAIIGAATLLIREGAFRTDL